MKLLRCLLCDDVFTIQRTTRWCLCCKSTGQLMSSLEEVTYSGPCQVIFVDDVEMRAGDLGEASGTWRTQDDNAFGNRRYGKRYYLDANDKASGDVEASEIAKPDHDGDGFPSAT